MDFEKWVEGYKVRVFPWIDGKTIYVNVQRFEPGSSIAHPPKWEQTVYITDNDNGRNMIKNFLSSLVLYIAGTNFPKDHKVVITA